MLTVRPATPADLDTLVAGNADMAAETEQLQLDLPTVRLGVGAVLDGRAAGQYWVAEHDGRSSPTNGATGATARCGGSNRCTSPATRGASASSARSTPESARKRRRPAPVACGSTSTNRTPGPKRCTRRWG
jgi:hypothetical protein